MPLSFVGLTVVALFWVWYRQVRRSFTQPQPPASGKPLLLSASQFPRYRPTDSREAP